ncbi:MAG: thioredoxin-dependent thiol peroxidase [Patescibacteria group bacterium]
MSLATGERAPDFMLPDQDGNTHELSGYRGKWVLLYFYPKDDTPGCTAEACSMRDNMTSFLEAGLVVLGVSVDPVAKHVKFADKYQLNFPLLSDETKEVVEAYEVWGEKKFMGRVYTGIYRVSYLINPDGVIVKVYDPVKAAGHGNEVLKDFMVIKNS